VNIYETVFITRQELSLQQAKQLTEKFTAILTEQGGTIGREEFWGLRSLAYPIKKNRKGYYTMFNHQSPAAALNEMQRRMGISDDILRELTIRLDKMPEEPSPIAGQRSDGDRAPSDSFGGEAPRETAPEQPSSGGETSATAEEGPAEEASAEEASAEEAPIPASGEDK
jgi:small subunit ribosomal protein S6